MKKIFIAASFLAAGFIAQAQTLNLGLKGGLNLATIDHNQDNTIKNRTDYHAGIFVNIPVSSQISVQPEAVYSSQGAKYTIGNNEVHNLQLNYVNIPLMVQANVGRGFYAQAGPQLGILTSVNDKVGDVETNFFEKNDFKSTDVALGVGLGYKGASGLGLDARYNLGLTNINNVGSSNIKNNVFQLGLQLQLSGRR